MSEASERLRRWLEEDNAAHWGQHEKDLEEVLDKNADLEAQLAASQERVRVLLCDMNAINLIVAEFDRHNPQDVVGLVGRIARSALAEREG